MRSLLLSERLSRIERAGLIFLATVPFFFGALVEVRGAFLKTRRTDLAVFARAAWATRNGVDVYSITDDKGLHYHYPPLLAILMAPLADPPPGASTVRSVPFAFTVGIWYVLSVGLAFLGIHTLANALTDSSPQLTKTIGAKGSRGWWALRVIPLLACLLYMGHALVIGQINVLWMALTCWTCAAILRGKRFKAGLLLALAICVKVIPALLILYPLWRRDRRCLAGATSGLVLGLVVVPVLFLGMTESWHVARKWADVMLLPVMGLGNDLSRDQELLGVWSTHNQAFAPILHKTIYILAGSRPEPIASAVQAAGILIGLLLTGVTLLARGWRASVSPINDVLCIGALCVNMITLSPGGHPHYLLLLVPLIMALMAAGWDHGDPHSLSPWLRAFVILVPIASALPLIVQHSGILYDLGMPIYSALLFWGAACYRMWQARRPLASATRLEGTIPAQSIESAAA
jgi:hypothetical protein